MEKKKYPIGAEHYTLYEEVGTGVSACVYRALCNSLNEVVAIKVLDFERDNCDLDNICREAQTMVLVDHPNVVKSHCSFVHDHNLWVVMPYMAGGSCLHILKAAYPDGFEEVVIATILREALKGLEYLHSQGHIHRDVKAGNILIDGRGCVKLGDFGVSACLFDSGDRRRQRNTFVGTPCWMAPEVMEQLNGYDFKADIWSFGITALELAHGHAPFSKYPPMKVLLMTLQNAPPGLDYERDKKFSKSFKQMIGSCLVKDPSRRPSSRKLLKHSFFKQARSTDYISRTLLEGLPDLPVRLQELKRKEEDMRAQKKMADGQKEEISQNEYKRGISSWDFDLNDLKAQASLLQDEDLLSDKDLKGSTSSLSDLDRQYQRQSSTVSQSPYQRQWSISTIHSSSADSDDSNQPAQLSSADTATFSNTSRSVKSSDEVSVPSLMRENSFSHNEINMETNSVNKLETEGAEKPSDHLKTNSRQSDKSQSQSQSTSTNNGDIVNTRNNQVPSETSLKASKATVNGDDQDDKGKLQVVQQRGRFKVTSESVDFDKVPPCSILQKSHSMQVISQHPAMTSPVTTVDSTPPHILNHSLYPMLQSILQSNISQREGILSLMKQLSIGETAVVENAVEGGGMPLNTNITEKSPLEAAHDREKELLHEITDLQWRLICAQEELQKYKTENAQASI